jgi:hypothetical protein
MTTLTTTPAPSRTPLVAAGSVVFAVALNALGVFADGTEGADHSTSEFLVVCGFIVVAAALVFGRVVPRGLKKIAATGQAGVAALVLSVLALLVIVPAFWSGLPPVLAAGGIVLGLAGRGARRSGLATAATAVGLLAVLADVAIYAMDWMSTNGVI